MLYEDSVVFTELKLELSITVSPSFITFFPQTLLAIRNNQKQMKITNADNAKNNNRVIVASDRRVNFLL